VISSSSTFIAEYPVLIRRNNGYIACWSELSLQRGDSNEYDWTPSCLSGTPGNWSDITPPVFSVGSEWRPSLGASENGSFWMAYTLNIDDTNQSITGNGLWVLRFNPNDGGWLGLETPLEDSNFATDAALAMAGEEAFIAYTSSDAFSNPRSTRNIRLYRAASPKGELLLSPMGTTALEGATSDSDDEISWPWSQSVSADRLERPGLMVVGDSLHVAALAYSSEKVSVVYFSADTTGETWSETETATPIGRVLAHVAPQWREDGTLFWARYSAQNTVEICNLEPDAESGSCTDTGSSSIAGLSIDEDSVQVSVLDASEIWTTQILD
jgi:hypothetical protein